MQERSEHWTCWTWSQSRLVLPCNKSIHTRGCIFLYIPYISGMSRWGKHGCNIGRVEEGRKDDNENVEMSHKRTRPALEYLRLGFVGTNTTWIDEKDPSAEPNVEPEWTRMLSCYECSIRVNVSPTLGIIHWNMCGYKCCDGWAWFNASSYSCR